MNCLVLPVSMLIRCYAGSRLRYQPLTEDGIGEVDGPVKVVVGKEKREFLVDRFVLEESPFRVLIETVSGNARNNNINEGSGVFDVMKKQKRIIFVDVDSILFEHMLWLMRNDCASLLELNVKEIIDFYSQDC